MHPQEGDNPMGTVCFKGDSPFELKLQKDPRADASGASVVLTFPVFVADIPGQTAPVEIAMRLRDAEWLAEMLRVAIVVAQDNLRLGG
jgi:hypothetical protein